MSALLSLLRVITRRARIRLLILSALAGLANAGILAGINSAAAEPSMAGGTRTLLLILLLVALYRTTQFAVMTSAARQVEAILHHIRGALAERVLKADLQPLEAIGRQALFGGIARDTQTISESLTVLLVGVQSAVLILFALLYIATLSLPAFVLTTLFIAATMAVQWLGMRRSRSDIDDASRAEAGLFGDVDDLLGGFSQVKMSAARAEALLAQIRGRTADTARAMSRMRRRTADQFVFGQASLLLLLGATVFAVPLLAPSYASVIVKVTTAILFVIGSVGLLVQSGPVLLRAEAASVALARLSERLDDAVSQAGGEIGGTESLAAQNLAAQNLAPQNLAPQTAAGFERLCLDGLQFRYPALRGEPGFAIGPLQVAIRRGEMVFITGGNGAGKTTLIRLITGLYRPGAGQIRLDERCLMPADVPAYRSLIAAVFGDYHLFARLYVMPAGGAQRVLAELETMELTGKTALEGDAFTSIELSAGQRRRLALLVALLQDRPILVLDEVAADFDPGFRQRFYEEILPGLRDAGKTIIAASHDDRYFHVADRILELEDGRIRERSRLPR